METDGIAYEFMDTLKFNKRIYHKKNRVEKVFCVIKKHRNFVLNNYLKFKRKSCHLKE